MKIHNTSYQKGQALITFLFFTIIAIAVISAAVVVVLLNSLGNAAHQDSQMARAISESGLDNALLRLIRDPNYGGESYLVDGNTIVITVTGNSPYTIVSKGIVGSYARTITATASYSAGMLKITTVQEQ